MARQPLNQADLEAVRQLLSAALVERTKVKMYGDACQDRDLQAWLKGETKTAHETISQSYTLLGAFSFNPNPRVARVWARDPCHFPTLESSNLPNSA